MTLSEYTLTWVGKNFNGQAPAQCMLFVRHCLQETDAPIKDKVTVMPVDGLETYYALASSLAGRDCGQLITRVDDLRADDISFFKDTYGNWPAGTITHVGIICGSQPTGPVMVHRPTAARPVERVTIDIGSYWDTHFRCALRWNKVAQDKFRELKWFMHDDKSKLLVDGEVNNSNFNLTNSSNQLVINNKRRKLVAAEVRLIFEDL